MKIKKVIVIGAGTMGQGIAQWFSQQHILVELVDINYEFALTSLERIHSSFDKLLDNKKLSLEDVALFKKQLTVKRHDQMSTDADLVIEAIIENSEAKKKLFHHLDQVMNPEAIIATNTSSFPITQLGNELSEKRKSRFIGLHFFNPATLMKLVEVISGVETDPKIAAFLIDWFNEKKKIACRCSDSPGFIVNRVARNFYGEALRAVETYSADKCSEVDTVMREVGGFKMGPFELMDLIGIDINFSVTESVYNAFFQEVRFKPHKLQRDMVAAGRLGKKTKKGFYHYES